MQPAHSCSKRYFSSSTCYCCKGMWLLCGWSPPICLQWSGRASTASLPSRPAARQDGLEPKAEQHQPCQTADFQRGEVKDESARNQAGNLIFSKETTDRINIFPQSGFWLHQITFLRATERRPKFEWALSIP